ncbi:lactococcin 972 family bacteriocin [Brevibacterium ammoniilyticum]
MGPAKKRAVGGGTWITGSYTKGITKYCYSKYYHPKKKHSATAILAPKSKRVVKKAGSTAVAQVSSALPSVCNTYWSTH